MICLVYCIVYYVLLNCVVCCVLCCVVCCVLCWVVLYYDVLTIIQPDAGWGAGVLSPYNFTFPWGKSNMCFGDIPSVLHLSITNLAL